MLVNSYRVRFRKSQIAIAVRPLPKDPYSSLIEFTPGYSGTWKHHKDSIKNFLSPYGHGKYAGTSVKCKWNHVLDKTNWCHVSRRRLIDWTHDVHCSKSENYGYTMGQPCIYLRPTKVFDWEPEPYYNLTEAFSHPTMPKFIKDKINATWIKFCQGKLRIFYGVAP